MHLIYVYIYISVSRTFKSKAVVGGNNYIYTIGTKQSNAFKVIQRYDPVNNIGIFDSNSPFNGFYKGVIVDDRKIMILGGSYKNPNTIEYAIIPESSEASYYPTKSPTDQPTSFVVYIIHNLTS